MAYIYEHIRTQGYLPLHMAEHHERLNVLAKELFCHPVCCSCQELTERIEEALRSGGCSMHTHNAVCVRYFDNGTVEVEPVEMIYNTYSLRALRPEGYICRVSGDLITKNTSANESLLELNRTTAQIADRGVAIWVGEGEEVLSIDGAAVIAVLEDEIRFSHRGEGVEFEIARRTMRSRNRKVSTAAIMVDDLMSAKEMLAVDYRGVTALEGFGSHRYMDITAEKIAQQVALAEER